MICSGVVDDTQPQEGGIEQTGLADDPLERVNAQQEGGPERQNDDEQQDALRALDDRAMP